MSRHEQSFLLNELDGFHSNTGVVVIATTNHPEKLDAAILERPSRFDRKYYFQLPCASERFAYVTKWNQELQEEMHVTEAGVMAVVKGTKDFSFAYMKELFVAAMVEVLLSQTKLLRSQMNSKTQSVNNP